MKLKIVLLSLLVVALLSGSVVYLQSGDKEVEQALPQVISQLPGYTFVKRFEAGGGMQGLILEDIRHDIAVVYVAPDGEHIIAGTMLSPEGKNLTEEYAQLYAPERDYTAQFEALTHSLSIAEGQGSRPLYVIYEPNCGFCKKLHASSRKYVDKSLFHWVPVAFLGARPGEGMPEQTLKVIQAIVDDKNPAQALAKSKQRTLTPASSVTDEVRQQVANNNSLMASFGISGTPAVIWKDSEGKIQVLKGLPQEAKLASILSDLRKAGLAQK